MKMYKYVLTINSKVKFPTRGIHTTYIKNAIKPNDTIPNVDLFEETPDRVVNLRKCFRGKKIVLFAVPGAFTPVCTEAHLPGYIHRACDLKCFGVDDIVCVSVNDPYVMAAWGKENDAHGKVRMLADTTGCFTKAMGLGIHLNSLGGFRSKRYSAVIQNGVLQSLNVEPDGIGLSISSAENLCL